MLSGAFVSSSVRRTALFGTLVSVVYARSFPRVGQRVGQQKWFLSKSPLQYAKRNILLIEDSSVYLTVPEGELEP